MRLPDLQHYCFLDPATKRKPGQTLKKVRARTAIVVVAVDESLALPRYLVAEAWADKSTTQTVVEKVFRVYEAYRPRLFGVEANGPQELFGDMLTLEAQRRGLKVPFVEVRQPTNIDKHSRNRTVIQPLWDRGQIVLARDQDELFVELTTHPSGQTVDLVDALAGAITLAPKRAAQAVRNEERDQLASYLRRAGFPAEAIAARMAEYDRIGPRPSTPASGCR